MKISKLTPGMRLYSLSTHKMGHTSISTLAVHLVTVTSVAEDGSWFEASWNGNPARWYREVPSNWRRTKPYVVVNSYGKMRKATTKEVADTPANRLREGSSCIQVLLNEGGK